MLRPDELPDAVVVVDHSAQRNDAIK